MVESALDELRYFDDVGFDALLAESGRTGDRELLVAHVLFWYAMTAAYSAIWFLVYVTK